MEITKTMFSVTILSMPYPSGSTLVAQPIGVPKQKTISSKFFSVVIQQASSIE
jgi:lambda repressor-like predicted transcriptional regulator